MALTPQNNEAFFREVDEQVRAEQMLGFWRRYGRLVIGLVVAALVALAGALWWQHHRAEVAGRDSEVLAGVLADLGEGKKDGAKAKLDTLAGSPRKVYSAAARLTQAALAVENNDTKGGIAQYKAIADDSGVAQPFRDLAIVRQTALEFDSLPPAQVIARLQPLAVAGNPWFGSAGEMVAVAHLKMNQRGEAGRLFGLIAHDQSVPETLRARATRMAGMLGVDTVPAPAAAGKD